MAIQFNCNRCKQTLKVDDRHAGAKVRCPKCGAISLAPAAKTLPDKPAVARTPAEKPAVARAPADKPAAAKAPTDERAETRDEKRAKPPQALNPDLFEEVEPVKFVNKQDVDNEMDMTPMIDCVFLLLIFFMVTAAFSLQKSLEVPTPDEDKAAAQQRIVDPEEGNVVVRIDSDSTVWVNGSEAPAEQDLLVKLREAKEGAPGSDSPPINSLLVMADGDARHEVVIMVLDAGNSLQMEPIKLVTTEEDDL